MKKILIMAGGTGGHIFPALAVAKALVQQGIEVQWLGTRQGMESEWVSKANFPISYINIGQWRGTGFKKLIFAPFQLMRALVQAIKILRKINPDVVLGVGGFASGPGGLAALILRKPLVLQEQNAIPGLTNRVLARGAKCIIEAFPNTFKKFRSRVITAGNPVRSEITDLPPPEQRMAGRDGRLRLLVIGGSQGAMIINQTLPKALSILSSEERPEVWHQTGKKGLVETRRAYQVLHLDVRLDDFIENMAEAYAWADLVLCRAGALTLAELAATGLASILIPYPYAADNHQMRNAEYFANAKAAILLPQTQFTPVKLAEVLEKILSDRATVLKMGTAAKQLYQPDSTQKVIDSCFKAAKNRDKETPKTEIQQQEKAD